MIELGPEQRELLHKALMEAFPHYQNLEEMVDFKLDYRLTEIVPDNQPHGAIVLKLITWAKSQGKTSELIEGAHEYSPKNPQLNNFYKNVWLPLITSSQPSPITAEQSSQQTSNVVELDTYRHSSEQVEDKVDASINHNENEDSDPVVELFPPSVSSQKRADIHKGIVISLHEHIELARNNILEGIDLLRPEKNIYGDQCQFVSSKVKEAGLEIQEAAQQIAQLPFMHVPSYYLLLSEQAYFGREVTNVTGLLHRLSNHISSLVVRKEIWDKLHKLKKSSQEMDNFIDDFSENVDKPKER